MSELYELPDGWEWKKLSDIGKISTGKTPPKANKEFYENGTLRFVKPPNLQNSTDVTTTENDEFITEDGAKKSTLLPKNTLMVCCIGSLGKFALSTENIITNQQINSIIFDEKIIDFKYGYYYGFKFEKLLNEVANEAVVKIVNKTIFSNLDIPIPPLPEQQRIVSKLDLLFEKIDRSMVLHQKNMDEANAFMGSVLNDVFAELEGNYEKRTLESFNKKMSSGGTPSRKEIKYWNGTIEWFSSGELNQLFTLPSKEKITQTGLDNTSAKLFSKGTLLIGMYDTAAMKMSILSNDGSCNQAIVGFKPKEDELNIFFAKYQLEHMKKEILEQRQGVRQQNLNLSKIKNVEIEYPPLPIQQKVVIYLDEISQKIEKIKQLQKEKMDSLKALKASILDSAFRGEL